jgi:hypothetical protein
MTQPNPIESDTPLLNCNLTKRHCKEKGFCVDHAPSKTPPKTELPDLDEWTELDDMSTFAQSLKTLLDLSDEKTTALESLIVEQFSHGTVDGWCCGCEADQAFMERKIEQRSEAFLNKARAEAYEDCGSKGGDGGEVRAYAKSRAARLKSKDAETVAPIYPLQEEKPEEVVDE